MCYHPRSVTSYTLATTATTTAAGIFCATLFDLKGIVMGLEEECSSNQKENNNHPIRKDGKEMQSKKKDRLFVIQLKLIL